MGIHNEITRVENSNTHKRSTGEEIGLARDGRGRDGQTRDIPAVSHSHHMIERRNLYDRVTACYPVDIVSEISGILRPRK